MTFAFHVTLAPSWFDPSTAPPQITPYGILYALHDGLVRPLPGKRIGASLAESWKESPDGLTYEFRMRRGLTFHNGDPVTLEDVKFSFERYKGAGVKELQARVRQLEIVDPHTIRFHLKEPWPDFLTFYCTPAGAAGLVLEAFTGHRRKVPSVKRLVMKSVPETTTRVAMLKGGEADVAACLGFCPPTGNIVPRVLDFALQVPPPAWDLQKAKQLRAEAGFPNGLDAGDFTPIPPFAAAEAMVNDLKTAGIRVKIRPLERAAFIAAWREKKLRGLFFTAAGNAGNAASRVEAFIYSKGSFAYGGTRTSTISSSSRRASATSRSAKRCCTRSSSSRSTA